MNYELEIKPCVGLSTLLFGAKPNEAEECFGSPEDKELIDDIEEAKSTVWHYWEQGFSLFFDEGSNNEFCCVEIDNPQTILWGIKIFDLNEKKIIDLFQQNGYTLSDSELHDWGEKRISFDDANIDFYFQKNKLVSINFGKQAMATKILILPN
jgi:hypothetical protein